MISVVAHELEEAATDNTVYRDDTSQSTLKGGICMRLLEVLRRNLNYPSALEKLSQHVRNRPRFVIPRDPWRELTAARFATMDATWVLFSPRLFSWISSAGGRSSLDSA